jgi:hypothetical protein
MLEQQPGIFREVNNAVDAIEECSAVCRPLGRASFPWWQLALAYTYPECQLPRHYRRCHLIYEPPPFLHFCTLTYVHMRVHTAQTGIPYHLQIIQLRCTSATSRTQTA